MAKASAMAPTKLGAIIKKSRKIKKFRPNAERRAEVDDIIKGIRAADGMSLKGIPAKTVQDAINGGLNVADHVEATTPKNVMTGQPEEQAAQFIRTSLELPELLK